MLSKAVLVTLSAGAIASQCPAGQKSKDDVTNIFCATSDGSDTAGCADCCQADTKTCGGVTGGVTCGFDDYAQASDAWKSTPTTEDTKNKDCCRPKATCGNTLYTCPPGMKQKNAAVATIKCPGDSASCSTSLCCENDADTCGGYKTANAGAACVGGLTDAITDKTWKAIKFTPGGNALKAFKAACCGAQATCATGQCPPGYTMDKTKKTAKCAGTTCTKKELLDIGCCKPNTKVCADPGAAPTCPPGQYYPGSAEWQSRKKGRCCTSVATCASAICPAGWKMKKNVETLSCSGDHTTCSSGTTPKCCEKDTATCGGLAGISCPYGFFDETKTWTAKTTEAVKNLWRSKSATEATKNKACCTAQAACSAASTTTPSPVSVVTQTPAFPIAARRYSEHKVALAHEKHGEKSANMVWLAVGGVLGMAALMVAQGYRSSARDIDDRLIE